MTSRRRFRVAVFATAAGLLGAACGGSATDTAAEPQATVAEAADTVTGDTTAPAVGDTSSNDVPSILQFTNALIGGGELDASTLADKPTVFWFWSPN